MNKVSSYWYDPKQNLGRIEINGKGFSLSRHFVGYRKNLTTAINRYYVYVANDWNMSNRFFIESAQIRGLISKIEKHPHKLV